MQVTNAQYQKNLWWLILITVVVKILLSFLLELGNDEVYYYTYALQPDWNHFDHPPMVGWMIRLSTLNLHWLSDLSMRLGSIISAAIATLLVFKTGTILKNERAGFLAALLYSLSIYTSIIAGLFVLPDSPQMVFFCASIYLMVKWTAKPHWFTSLDWIALGLCIGLATLSKVHGLYLWAGFGAFLIFHQSTTFKKPYLYISGIITLLCLIPIVYWNIENDFITYRYHSERVTHTGIRFDTLLQQIVGEWIYQNPIVYIICLIPFFRLDRTQAAFQNKESIRLLLWLSIPLILTFWIISLFNPTLPHWTGPGFISLFLIAGVYWEHWSSQVWPSLFKWAMGLLLVFIVGFISLVYLFPTQLGSKEAANLGEYNPINDVSGWSEFKGHFEALVAKDIQSNKMPSGAPILTQKWFPGGHILFYVAQPLHMPVIAVGKLEDVHKFAWLNQSQNSLQVGQNAYYIAPSNLPSDPQVLYGAYFEKIELAASFPIISKGVELRNFKVYRLLNCNRVPSAILAPIKR
jgi:hypothetical protein